MATMFYLLHNYAHTQRHNYWWVLSTLISLPTQNVTNLPRCVSWNFDRKGNHLVLGITSNYVVSYTYMGSLLCDNQDSLIEHRCSMWPLCLLWASFIPRSFFIDYNNKFGIYLICALLYSGVGFIISEGDTRQICYVLSFNCNFIAQAAPHY